MSQKTEYLTLAELHALVVQAMKEQDLKQHQVADMAGVRQSSVSDATRHGPRRRYAATLVKIANALGYGVASEQVYKVSRG